MVMLTEVKSQRKMLILAILCVLVIFVVYNNPAVLTQFRHSFILLNQKELVVEDLNVCSGKRLVLYWTKFFEADDFNVGFGNKPFEKCLASSCCATKNRSLVDQSDAVIFHIRDLVIDDMPPRRLPHQRWIFYLLESPRNTPNILKDLGHVFNWTMTYRADSDIYVPYPSVIVETIRESVDAASFQYSELQRLVRGKKKLAAWFVSNCFSTSGRERYAAELQKYVHVDVYGQCGSLKCSDRIQCYQFMERDYKFYLAFENSICRDYITEKLYNALLFQTVPVVYGGGNYSAVAPKGSYIDTRDFPSVEDLGEYLKFLDRNESAYMRYFEWRKMPNALSSLPKLNDGWCTLCSMLVNNASLRPSSYSNIHFWWFDKGDCQNDTHIPHHNLLP